MSDPFINNLDFIKHQSDLIFDNKTNEKNSLIEKNENNKLLVNHNYTIDDLNQNKKNEIQSNLKNNSIDIENLNDDDNLVTIKELKSTEIIYKIKMQNQEPLIITPLQTGSFYSTLLFSIFSTLGSGIIILPITMNQLGIIWATLLFILCALISYFTLYQLVIEAYKNNMYYFSDLVEFKYGKRVLIFVEICFHICNLLGVTVFNKVSKYFLIFCHVFHIKHN